MFRHQALQRLEIKFYPSGNRIQQYGLCDWKHNFEILQAKFLSLPYLVPHTTSHTNHHVLRISFSRSGPSFWNTCVEDYALSERYERQTIVHLKKESNKSIFLLEKGMAVRWSLKGLRYGEVTHNHKTCELQPVCYGTLHDNECSNCRELYEITSKSRVL
ncbi:hypothetical protein TNCV_541001 [Trichonephila clavipes]|nr:hypothetical protein TNCV_541001 [Trichonephila clavipes]